MMKVSKWISGIFAVLGAGLAAGTVWVSLTFLHAPPVLLTRPEAASERVEAMMEAVCAGDYAAAGDMMYGQPDMGAGRAPDSEVGALIWDAFQESLSYEFTGECYATDSGVARDVTISALDISSVTEHLKERSQTLLTQRVAEAEDVEEIYGADNEYREDFVMKVLYDAAVQALEEDARYKEWEVTLNLTYQQGQWWVIPGQALLEAISGGIAG